MGVEIFGELWNVMMKENAEKWSENVNNEDILERIRETCLHV